MTDQSIGVGRELDALVAVKVMGWPVGSKLVPAYSTNIAAAWEVVAEMRKRGWVYCTVQSLPTKAEMPEWDDATMSVQWWVEFSRYRSPVEATSPHCTTSAEAICLAALQAVGA